MPGKRKKKKKATKPGVQLFKSAPGKEKEKKKEKPGQLQKKRKQPKKEGKKKEKAARRIAISYFCLLSCSKKGKWEGKKKKKRTHCTSSRGARGKAGEGGPKDSGY